MLGAFFAMGGYAAFVWPAYAITVLGIALAVILTARAYNQAKKRLVSLEKRPER